jgi:hypothetical protein
MTQKMSKELVEYRINLPKEIDAFDILQALGDGIEFENLEHYISELIWINEQGCSQAMRND